MQVLILTTMVGRNNMKNMAHDFNYHEKVCQLRLSKDNQNEFKKMR